MTNLDPGDEVAYSVRRDRLEQLFVQSAPAVLGSFLAAVMLCWLGWERFDQQRVIVWMTLLGLSTGVRAAMFLAYLRAPANQRTAERWEWRYWVTLMLSAAIWGWGAFAVMPTDDALGQTLIWADARIGARLHSMTHPRMAS